MLIAFENADDEVWQSRWWGWWWWWWYDGWKSMNRRAAELKMREKAEAPAHAHAQRFAWLSCNGIWWDGMGWH